MVKLVTLSHPKPKSIKVVKTINQNPKSKLKIPGLVPLGHESGFKQIKCNQYQ